MESKSGTLGEVFRRFTGVLYRRPKRLFVIRILLFGITVFGVTENTGNKDVIR